MEVGACAPAEARSQWALSNKQYLFLISSSTAPEVLVISPVARVEETEALTGKGLLQPHCRCLGARALQAFLTQVLCSESWLLSSLGGSGKEATAGLQTGREEGRGRKRKARKVIFLTLSSLVEQALSLQIWYILPCARQQAPFPLHKNKAKPKISQCLGWSEQA